MKSGRYVHRLAMRGHCRRLLLEYLRTSTERKRQPFTATTHTEYKLFNRTKPLLKYVECGAKRATATTDRLQIDYRSTTDRHTTVH